MKSKRPTPSHRLRKQPAGHETLERLKRWPSLARQLYLPVHIYSGEHRGYWRQNKRGYTSSVREAGQWDISDALKITRHCGPEKMIEFHSLF